MKKLFNKNESGRSMVEMLGVLAVIGVLSIGGIAGYRYAVKQMSLNQLSEVLNLMIMETVQENSIFEEILDEDGYFSSPNYKETTRLFTSTYGLKCREVAPKVDTNYGWGCLLPDGKLRYQLSMHSAANSPTEQLILNIWTPKDGDYTFLREACKHLARQILSYDEIKQRFWFVGGVHSTDSKDIKALEAFIDAGNLGCGSDYCGYLFTFYY